MSNPSIVAFIVSEIKAFMRTDGQEDMADRLGQWSWLRIFILHGYKNIYTLSHSADILYTAETLPSTCYVLSDEPSTPFYPTINGYK